MANFEWSQVFMSIEGEGPFSGHPTVYVRFARCNFKCPGFNNPTNCVDNKGYACLPFDPKDINDMGESISLMKFLQLFHTIVLSIQSLESELF